MSIENEIRRKIIAHDQNVYQQSKQSLEKPMSCANYQLDMSSRVFTNLIKSTSFTCSTVLNATFNKISALSWRSVLLVEETGVAEENHRPAANHWQTSSHNVVSSTSRLNGIITHNVGGDWYWLSLKSTNKCSVSAVLLYVPNNTEKMHTKKQTKTNVPILICWSTHQNSCCNIDRSNLTFSGLK
jgi:hypothetical protein